jgi:membrane protease YdiL (CAAX protease family)
LVGVDPERAPSNTAPTPLTASRRIADIFVILLVGFTTTAIANVMVIFGRKPTYSSFELNLGLIENVLTEVACLAVLFTVLRYRQQSPSTLGLRLAKEDFLPGIGLFFGAYAVFIALYYAALAVAPSLGATSRAFDFSQFGSSSPVLLTLFLLVNPCFEEIVVRGYLSSEILALTPRKWVAVTLPALFQGSYHLYQGRLTAIAFTGMFFLFSIYFVRTGRLVPVVIAHAVFDLTLIWQLWA